MPTPGTVTAKMIMELIERQNFRCALSGRVLTPDTASLDHMIPLSRGGAHDLSNLWIVDHKVNAAKSSLTVDEFAAICREVTSHREGISETHAS